MIGQLPRDALYRALTWQAAEFYAGLVRRVFTNEKQIAVMKESSQHQQATMDEIQKRRQAACQGQVTVAKSGEKSKRQIKARTELPAFCTDLMCSSLHVLAVEAQTLFSA